MESNRPYTIKRLPRGGYRVAISLGSQPHPAVMFGSVRDLLGIAVALESYIQPGTFADLMEHLFFLSQTEDTDL